MRAYSLRITSGTMGGPPLLVARHRSPGPELFEHFPGGKAIAVFAGNASTSLRFLCDLLVDAAARDRRILILGAGDLGTMDSVFSSFRPDFVLGAPSFVAEAISCLSGSDVRRGVRVVHMNGEPLSAELEAQLRRMLPRAAFATFYATAEIGQVSDHTCGHLPRGTFHPLRGVRVEVSRPDGDGVGEVVISAPLSASVVLERYRTGDLGRIVPDPCSCGRRETFQLLGRKDAEVVRLAGMTLVRTEFDRVMRELARYVIDYRATACERIAGGRVGGEIDLAVVPAAGLSLRRQREEFLSRAIADRLRVTPTRTFADLLRAGAPVSLRVRLVPPFPASAKVVRLRKIPGSGGTTV